MRSDPSQTTVASYSRCAAHYEDAENRDFLYGDVTREFLTGIELHPRDEQIVDLGCGTGFGFEVLRHAMVPSARGLGIEPSEGMIEVARHKFRDDPRFDFRLGSFESIPVDSGSVDRIISTLALHWVPSIEVAAAEVRRVLKPTGGLDILMVSRRDGEQFKKAVLRALQRHLGFGQIMRATALVQRLMPKDIEKAFAVFESDFQLEVEEFRRTFFGDFQQHLTWWRARSAAIIAEVQDRAAFLCDLQEELEKLSTDRGIPFDASFLRIRAHAR